MKPQAIVGAVVGGVVGALIWAAILHYTGYEVGYVAWGIGLLVGAGCRMLGGAGQGMAATCAIVAVGGILLGKVLGVSLAIDAAGPEFFKEIQGDAAAFAQLNDRSEYAEFMKKHGYSPQGAQEVTEEMIAEFEAAHAPALRQIAAGEMGFDEWLQSPWGSSVLEGIRQTVPVWDTLVEGLGLFDIVFAILGIVTAYRMVAQVSVGGSGSQRPRDAELEGSPAEGGTSA